MLNYVIVCHTGIIICCSEKMTVSVIVLFSALIKLDSVVVVDKKSKVD